MRAPQSLDEAKAMIREERGKIHAAFRMIIGSRAALAVLTVFVVAFGAQLMFARNYLPPTGAVSLAQIGLPGPAEFGAVEELVAEARAAAVREDVPGSIQTIINEYRDYVWIANVIGLVVSLCLLIWNMAVNAADRRYRSVTVVEREKALMQTNA